MTHSNIKLLAIGLEISRACIGKSANITNRVDV